MIKSTVSGYIENSEYNFNCLKELGFESKSSTFEPSANFIAIENHHLWFIEGVKPRSRLFNNKLTLKGIITDLNNHIDWSTSYASISLPAMLYLIGQGWGMEGLSESTTHIKFCAVTKKVKSLIVPYGTAPDNYNLIKFVNGKFINFSEPRIDIAKYCK